nr:hypothetical protein [Tanacetum cinerariifolium]
MAFKNFLYAEIDEDCTILSKEFSPTFGIGSPSVLINMEPPVIVAEPTGQLVENTADSGDSPRQEKLVVVDNVVNRRARELLKAKCEAIMADIHNNPAVKVLREKNVSLLVESDDMGKLVEKLVSSTIFFGRCHSFKEVTNMKEPFDITKIHMHMSKLFSPRSHGSCNVQL